jgi:hypothetical protein
MKRFLVGAVMGLVGCYKAAPPPAAPPPAHTAPAPRVESHGYRHAIGDPVGFLPANSEVVVAIDGEQLRKSSLWGVADKRIRAAASSGLATFTTACGFDPIDSIRSISFGLRGLKQSKPEGVIVISGMSRAKLTGCFDRQAPNAGGRLVVDHGVYTINTHDADPTTLAFTFVDDTTAVALLAPDADRAALEKTLAAGVPLRRSPTFTQLLAQVDTEAAAWAIVNGQSSVFDLTQGNQKPTAIWGSLHLDGGAAVSVRVRFADTAVAQQLAAQTQAQMGAAQAFFDRLDVTADGSELVIEAAMSETKLATLLNLVGMASAPPPPPTQPTLVTP